MASEPTFTNILEAKMLEVLLVQLQGLLYQILGLYRGYIGVMEKKMETIIMENQMEKNMENEMETREHMRVYRGYIGIMEKKMEGAI